MKILGLALSGLLIVSSGCSPKSEGPTDSARPLPTAQVQVQTAEQQAETASEETVGTVRAKLRATLEAKVSGRIDQLPVLLGQTVKRGQLVAHLDAAEIQARLDQAQAGLQQAERDWKRISDLFKQQAVTHAEYDAAEARWQQAKAGVAEAQAMLDYVQVRAPFDGVVTRKWVDVGDLAAPGKPLVDIEDPSRLDVETDIPEVMIGRVKLGATMPVRVSGVANPLTGTVSEIAPSADPNSRTFRVKLGLPSGANLRAGQFVRVAVPVAQGAVLQVPASAVVQRGEMQMVFVVADNHAAMRLVRTGKRLGERVEIASGLTPGESVVVANAGSLEDGQPVQVNP